jgi:hypothetical protein
VHKWPNQSMEIFRAKAQQKCSIKFCFTSKCHSLHNMYLSMYVVQYLTEAGLIFWLLFTHKGNNFFWKCFWKCFFLKRFLVCLICTNSYYFLA